MMRWPSVNFGRNRSSASRETTSATSAATVKVRRPVFLCDHARKPSPIPSTQMAKKSASGFVRASVTSTAKRTMNVAPISQRSYQRRFSRLLNVHEPRFTAIAPTTPMAYSPASASKSWVKSSTTMGSPTAMISGPVGTPYRLSLVNDRGMSPSSAIM